MKKPYLITLFLALSFFSVTSYSKECLISGKWELNKEKTIENINKTKLNAKQREIFSEFYKKSDVIKEHTCKDFKTHFEGTVSTDKYISMKEKQNIITIEYFNNAHNRIVKSDIKLHNQCYSLKKLYFNFREVYCRVK